jgi:hypothetical protein
MDGGTMSDKQSMVVCWEVLAGGLRCFTFAETRSRAKWNAVQAGRDAGYFQNYFPADLAAKRARRFDDSRLKDGSRRCFSPDYMY